MKIVADTATLFAPAEGEAQGMTIVPVCVTIDGKAYQDYAEITSEAFLEKIEAGGVPVSSQPAIGDLLDVFESSAEEMLVLAVFSALIVVRHKANLVRMRRREENKVSWI